VTYEQFKAYAVHDVPNWQFCPECWKKSPGLDGQLHPHCVIDRSDRLCSNYVLDRVADEGTFKELVRSIHEWFVSWVTPELPVGL
jgi:hypothetical protein